MSKKNEKAAQADAGAGIAGNADAGSADSSIDSNIDSSVDNDADKTAGNAVDDIADKNSGDGNPPAPPPSEGEGGTRIRAWHKSPHPSYRIAGIVLKQHPQDFFLTASQMEALRRDPWAALEEISG